MNFEPQKFFIGLMDFFSILLPGALLTFFLKDVFGADALGDAYALLEGAEGWTVFLFSSYLLGHIVFLLGSWLDEVYDELKAYNLSSQIKSLAYRGRKAPWPLRALAWLVFKADRDLALNRVVDLKASALEPLQAQSAVNSFQWSKALLAFEHHESLAAVQRFEADSKFFRCLVVVMVVLAAILAVGMIRPTAHVAANAGTLLAVTLVVALLGMWRYMEQRYKATNQAYWSVITCMARGGKALSKSEPRADGFTHAGGVVYRTHYGVIEYLTVEALDNPGETVLPKGHIEPGEDPRETAVREVHEETGVWARICQGTPAMPKILATRAKSIPTLFYLMEACGRDWISNEDRRPHRWLPIEQVEKLDYPESRELVLLANNTLLGLPQSMPLPAK